MYMKIKDVPTKSAAIRMAIRESLERETVKLTAPNFSSWIGLANKAQVNQNTKFKSDDDLWR